jgi:hypothetical protein
MASQTKTQTKTITFVVNVPVYVEMTKKKFKEEYGGTDALWERLLLKAGEREEIVEDAVESVDAEDGDGCESGQMVFNLIEDTVNDLKDAEAEEVEYRKEEVETATADIVDAWCADETFKIEEVGDLVKEETEFPSTMEGVYESATGKRLPRPFTKEEFMSMAKELMSHNWA